MDSQELHHGFESGDKVASKVSEKYFDPSPTCIQAGDAWNSIQEVIQERGSLFTFQWCDNLYANFILQSPPATRKRLDNMMILSNCVHSYCAAQLFR